MRGNASTACTGSTLSSSVSRFPIVVRAMGRRRKAVDKGGDDEER